MKRFIIKFSLFSLPILLLVGFPFAILLASGELVTVDKVVTYQQDERKPSLYGLAYSETRGSYKLKATLVRQPQVLVLGTSRTQQFRSAFFADTVTAYNAGGAVSRISHLDSFLAQIPETQQPELIILGLDQNFFNANWQLENSSYEQHTNVLDAETIFQLHWKTVYQDYLAGKFSLASVFRPESEIQKFGLNAIINGHGFRNDGSRDYGEFFFERDLEFQEEIRRIRAGIHVFHYAEQIDPDRLANLLTFLATCQERGIQVIGFLPPYPPTIQTELQARPEEYAYMWALSPTLRAIFAGYGFSFFDFSDVSELGATDVEFIDGTHGSEKVYLRLFIEMAKTDAALQPYTADIGYLEDRLATAKSDYDVFGYE